MQGGRAQSRAQANLPPEINTRRKGNRRSTLATEQELREGTHDEAQRGEQFLAVLAQLLHQHRQTPADSADPECERRRQRRTEKLKPEAKRAQLGG